MLLFNIIKKIQDFILDVKFKLNKTMQFLNFQINTIEKKIKTNFDGY